MRLPITRKLVRWRRNGLLFEAFRVVLGEPRNPLVLLGFLY
jgi:hypothetical protein